MVCPNPVAFTVFGHDIYWYGILISLAVVIAVVMVYMQAKKKGIDPDSMLDYALLTIPVAIVFARIYYVDAGRSSRARPGAGSGHRALGQFLQSGGLWALGDGGFQAVLSLRGVHRAFWRMAHGDVLL